VLLFLIKLKMSDKQLIEPSNYSVVKGSIQPDMELLQFDGLCAPNPGKGTSGAILYRADGTVILERGDYLGDSTNNIAEYTGLLIGIEECVKVGITNIRIEGDSMLVINQVSGKWQVKDAKLKVLHQSVMAMIQKYFNNVVIRHVYRENNREADRITNEVSKLGHSYYKKI